VEALEKIRENVNEEEEGEQITHGITLKSIRKAAEQMNSTQRTTQSMI